MPRAFDDDDKMLKGERRQFRRLFKRRADGSYPAQVTKAMIDVNYSVDYKIKAKVLFNLEEELCEHCNGLTVINQRPCRACLATGVQ
jgi:hypothetical protein